MATASLKKLFKRFPRSIKDTIPVLLNTLQDRLAPEHAALGSCTILSSRPISRYLMQVNGRMSIKFLVFSFVAESIWWSYFLLCCRILTHCPASFWLFCKGGFILWLCNDACIWLICVYYHYILWTLFTILIDWGY